jgi:hypothetical protein
LHKILNRLSDCILKSEIIVERLKHNNEMATKFKSIFDIAKVESIALAEANALFRDPEFQRKTTITLIEKLQWDNTQIAEFLRVPISFVKAIRLELKKAK